MKYTLGNIPLNVGTSSEVLADCRALFGRGGSIFTVNSLMAEEARKNGGFGDTLRSSDVNTVDGVGIKAALALRGVRAELLPGVRLGELIASEGAHTLALIGGRAGLGERAFSYLKGRNPRLELSFALSGYGVGEESYFECLSERRPSLCFVCLGSPRQEEFVIRARSVSPTTLFLALGGSIDIYSGAKRRAPKLIRAAGLEWLFRMIKEPERAAKLPKLLSFSLHSLFGK